MKNKAQMDGVGMIIVTAVVLIIGVILFRVIAQEVGDSTTLTTLANTTIVTPANLTAYYFNDYKYFDETTLIVTNASSGTVINSGNFTITNNFINPTTGALSVRLVPAADVGYYGKPWNVSVTAQRTDYIDSSSARSIAGIISVMFALAVLVVALIPSLRSEVMSMLNR